MIPPLSLIDVEQDDPAGRKAASSQISKARREGRLKQQPCVVCGATNDIACHHYDYSKPLDVVFLCRHHHHLFHGYLRRRLDELEYPEYTKAFHNQALEEFKRDFLEPPLFAKPKLPLRYKFNRPRPTSTPVVDRYRFRSIPQVAKLIGTSEPFVRGLVHRHEITYYNFGTGRGSYRIALLDLATWLAETGQVQLTT